MKKLALLLQIFALLSFAACKSNKNTDSKDVLQTLHLDSSTIPSDNFYQFAVGNWLKNNPVPSTESRWGSFNEVEERNKITLKTILEEAQEKGKSRGENWQKIGDFYASGMDSIKRNNMGISPLKKYLQELQSAKSWDDLSAIGGKWEAMGIGTFSGIFIEQDLKNSNRMVAYFYQPSLTLPEKSYYTQKDAETLKKQNAARDFMKDILTWIPEFFTDKEKAVQTIFGLETNMAKSSKSLVELRNPENNYHFISIKKFKSINPTFNWDIYLKNAAFPIIDSLVLGQPEFFTGLENDMKHKKIEDWKLWMAYKLLMQTAPYLGDEQEAAYFRFHQTAMRGVKEMKPRWERVMKAIEGYMGEALGQLFVEKTFKPEAKERMLKMVSNLQSVFKSRIQKLEWMGEETKMKAIVKLEKFMVKIGYPDRWRDYGTCKIQLGSYLENVLEASRFEYRRRTGKLGKPVDRSEWAMAPHIVNAYYNPSLNEIVFPAGILQPPFFDISADDALIYGAIGAVIGHEMTHGFDDEGSKFDAEGNLTSWWTPKDREQFEAKAKILIDQFNTYTVLDSLHVNGQLTLGENIADLGGLSIALDAFMHTEQAKLNKPIGGFTPVQRFFLSWANAWKNNITEDALRTRIMTDPHSPGLYRCNGPLSNMDEFYKAFHIEAGRMYRPSNERAIIW